MQTQEMGEINLTSITFYYKINEAKYFSLSPIFVLLYL